MTTSAIQTWKSFPKIGSDSRSTTTRLYAYADYDALVRTRADCLARPHFDQLETATSLHFAPLRTDSTTYPTRPMRGSEAHERDIILQFAPKRRYTIDLRIEAVTKGQFTMTD